MDGGRSGRYGGGAPNILYIYAITHKKFLKNNMRFCEEFDHCGAGDFLHLGCQFREMSVQKLQNYRNLVVCFGIAKIILPDSQYSCTWFEHEHERKLEKFVCEKKCSKIKYWRLRFLSKL